MNRTWSGAAAVELRRLMDELDAVAGRLHAARAESWASPAAVRYRDEIEEQHFRLRRLAGRAVDARRPVLTHTNAADCWTRADGC